VGFIESETMTAMGGLVSESGEKNTEAELWLCKAPGVRRDDYLNDKVDGP